MAYWKKPEEVHATLHFRVLQSFPTPTANVQNLDAALDALVPDIAPTLELLCEELKCMKVWPSLHVRYESANPTEEHFKSVDAHLRVPALIFERRQTSISGERSYVWQLQHFANGFRNANAKFIRDKSGLILAEIYSLNMNIVRFNPLDGSAWSPLPKFLAKKHAIVNVHNTDERCFGYAIASALHPIGHGQHPDRPNQLHTVPGGPRTRSTPVPGEPGGLASDRGAAEHQSQRVQLLRRRRPRSLSDVHQPARQSDRDRPALLQRSLRLDQGFWSSVLRLDTSTRDQKFFCRRCLGHFKTAEVLHRHQQLCTRGDFLSVIHTMPEPGAVHEFKNWKYGTWAPFVIYADLESVLAPADQRNGATHLYQQHKPCAASALLCSKIRAFDGRFCLFTGEDSVKRLLDQLVAWERECVDHLLQNRAMRPLVGAKLREFANATECCICHGAKGPFDPTDANRRKVADHDHVTGFFRGAAHDECNRNRRVVYEIPVFLHNFRGYDSHLIVRALKEYPTREIEPIAQNLERYLQVKWGENLVFRDSLQFLTASLESLVESLRKTDETRFTRLQSVIGAKYPAADHKLLLRKGVFPYEYLDSFAKMTDAQLPPREAFRSSLTGTECSVEDYAYAQQVWTAFGCRSLEDYLKLYLTSDVALLADVFQNFRDICFRGRYQLDPAYFVSAPQFAWNSMFKMLNLKLELISDPEMYRMIQPNIRGGICHASVRYARANNIYMGGLYDPTKPESYILYIDATNLYGWAMSQKLPCKNYEWLSDAEVREAEAALTGPRALAFFDVAARNRAVLARIVNASGPLDVSQIDPNTAYILEVDLEYPRHLHDRDDDYPLAPELLEIETGMLSQKHLELRRKYYGASNPYSRKLVCSLMPRKRYVVHSELLKFYIERGLVVTKVHRGVKFVAEAMLQPYIQYNTEQRAAAGTDECKRAFFKMMNNAPYGKTIENVAKRSDIRLLTDENQARRLAEKPHCVQFRAFDENLIGLELRKVKQLINKPFQVGFAILELSKLLMYRAYAQLKDHFGARVRMLYTDTDSLILQFSVPDLYRELRDTPNLRALFDFSKIPVGHPCGLGDPLDPHADEVGFFKDELKGDPIVEFVALKPKMYSFTTCKATLSKDQPRIVEKQVGKGIARAALRRLHHQDYVDMYNEGDATKVVNHRIGSKLHHVYTMAVEKRGLVCYDDKRYLLANLPDGTPNPNTHAFGHYDIVVEAEVEQPEAGNDLHIVARAPKAPINLRIERRFERKHKLAVKRAHALRDDDVNDDDPDIDAESIDTGAGDGAAGRPAAREPGVPDAVPATRARGRSAHRRRRSPSTARA